MSEEPETPRDAEATPAEPSGPAAEASGTPEPTGLRQPWVRFALGFGGIVAVTEVFYHAVALESDAFHAFVSGLAYLTHLVLTPLYDPVTLTGARVATADFTVTVNYGCDGLQVCTLLSAAILAFPASWRQKLVGLVAGNLWLQAWNVVRISTLVVIGGIHRPAFEPTHVYVWPTILIAICLATWMVWARWVMSDDESFAHA